MEVDILWQLSPLHQIAKTEPCGTAQDGFGSLLCVFLAVSVNIKIEECKDLRMLLSSCATFIPTTMLDLGSTEYNGELYSSLKSQKFSFKSRKLLRRGLNVWGDANILDHGHEIAFKTDFYSRVRVSVLYRICEFLFLLKSRIFAASKLLQTRNIFWVIQPLYSPFRRLFISKLFCLFTYGSVCRCALRAFTYRVMYKLEWQHGIWAGSSVK